jgi:hypothetical protein
VAVRRQGFTVDDAGNIVMRGGGTSSEPTPPPPPRPPRRRSGGGKKFLKALLVIVIIAVGLVGVKKYLDSRGKPSAPYTPATSTTPRPSQTPTPAQTPEAEDEYILPTDSRLITKEDLDSMSREEVRASVNEIYARHGRYFYTDAIRELFEGRSWYNPDPSLTDEQITATFSELEQKNLNFIVKYEQDKGWQ